MVIWTVEMDQEPTAHSCRDILLPSLILWNYCEDGTWEKLKAKTISFFNLLITQLKMWLNQLKISLLHLYRLYLISLSNNSSLTVLIMNGLSSSTIIPSHPLPIVCLVKLLSLEYFWLSAKKTADRFCPLITLAPIFWDPTLWFTTANNNNGTNYVTSRS